MCSVKQCKEFDNDGQNTGAVEEMDGMEKKRKKHEDKVG